MTRSRQCPRLFAAVHRILFVSTPNLWSVSKCTSRLSDRTRAADPALGGCPPITAPEHDRRTRSSCAGSDVGIAWIVDPVVERRQEKCFGGRRAGRERRTVLCVYSVTN